MKRGDRLSVFSRVLRDGGILLLVMFFLSLWQTRNMLDSGVSVSSANSQFISLDGSDYVMQENGKPWLLYFFAPWCSVCHLSIENTNNVPQQEVNVLLIAMDYDSVETVISFVNEHDLKAPVVLATSEQKNYFNVSGYPSYYVLDDALTIKSKSMGYATSLGLNIQRMLAL